MKEWRVKAISDNLNHAFEEIGEILTWYNASILTPLNGAQIVNVLRILRRRLKEDGR